MCTHLSTYIHTDWLTVSYIYIWRDHTGKDINIWDLLFMRNGSCTHGIWEPLPAGCRPWRDEGVGGPQWPPAGGVHLAGGGRTFVLFRPSAAWVRPTHRWNSYALPKVPQFKCWPYPSTPSRLVIKFTTSLEACELSPWNGKTLGKSDAPYKFWANRPCFSSITAPVIPTDQRTLQSSGSATTTPPCVYEGKSVFQRNEHLLHRGSSSKYPSTDEQIKKMWYMYTMEHYSDIKKHEVMPSTATWMQLEISIEWSESGRERQIPPWYHLYVESKIWYKWTHVQNRNRPTDTENRLVVAKGEEG